MQEQYRHWTDKQTDRQKCNNIGGGGLDRSRSLSAIISRLVFCARTDDVLTDITDNLDIICKFIAAVQVDSTPVRVDMSASAAAATPLSHFIFRLGVDNIKHVCEIRQAGISTGYPRRNFIDGRPQHTVIQLTVKDRPQPSRSGGQTANDSHRHHNSLPLRIRETQSLPDFKRRLKTHFFHFQSAYSTP